MGNVAASEAPQDALSCAIYTEHLSKNYGKQRGIEDVTLAVPRGMLFGFIGPNGAGKSTTIRTILGLLLPSNGRAWILGSPANPQHAQARLGVGYVPGEVFFPPSLRVHEFLTQIALWQGCQTHTRRDQLIERFAVDKHAKCEDLSLGNRKKVALVAALQHTPELVILDEPSNGLDPMMQSALMQTLREENTRGATVFFSSHQLSEVQRLCQRAAIMREGKLVAVEDLSQHTHQAIAVSATFAKPLPPQHPLLALIHDEQHEKNPAQNQTANLSQNPAANLAANLKQNAHTYTWRYRGPLPPLLRALADAQIHAPDCALIDLRIDEPSLEEMFWQYYKTS